jgi:tRNA-Thr(GGU) m(6)t(6)A37 methyltransferase TsaA
MQTMQSRLWPRPSARKLGHRGDVAAGFGDCGDSLRAWHQRLVEMPANNVMLAIAASKHEVTMEFSVKPIGRVESPLRNREDAPKQGEEGAPPAVLVFEQSVQAALADIRVGDRLLLLTWLDRADRGVLQVHPRDDKTMPLRGVFSTRSQDRPNPIGVHRVTVVSIANPLRVEVRDLEAFDGTPIVDVKATLTGMVE